MDSLIHLDLASVRPEVLAYKSINTSCNCLRLSTEVERINYLVSLAEEELSPAALAAKSAIKACVKELIQNQIWPCSEIIL